MFLLDLRHFRVFFVLNHSIPLVYTGKKIKSMTTILKKEVGEILYSVHKACVNGIRMKLPLSCCLTKDARPRVCYVPCNKGIRIPKSDKFCLENPESWACGIRNSALRIQDSA